MHPAPERPFASMHAARSCRACSRLQLPWGLRCAPLATKSRVQQQIQQTPTVAHLRRIVDAEPLGNPQDLGVVYRRCVQLRPNPPQARVLLGQLYEKWWGQACQRLGEEEIAQVASLVCLIRLETLLHKHSPVRAKRPYVADPCWCPSLIWFLMHRGLQHAHVHSAGRGSMREHQHGGIGVPARCTPPPMCLVGAGYGHAAVLRPLGIIRYQVFS